MLLPLGILMGIVGLVCAIIILVDAFKNSILKGLLCLICTIYMIYFALVEFKNENKWLIVVLWLVCGGAGGLLYKLGS